MRNNYLSLFLMMVTMACLAATSAMANREENPLYARFLGATSKATHIVEATVSESNVSTNTWTLPDGRTKEGPKTQLTLTVHQWLKTDFTEKPSTLPLNFAAGKIRRGQSNVEREVWPYHCPKPRVGDRAIFFVGKPNSVFCPLVDEMLGVVMLPTSGTVYVTHANDDPRRFQLAKLADGSYELRVDPTSIVLPDPNAGPQMALTRNHEPIRAVCQDSDCGRTSTREDNLGFSTKDEFIGFIRSLLSATSAGSSS